MAFKKSENLPTYNNTSIKIVWKVKCKGDDVLKAYEYLCLRNWTGGLGFDLLAQEPLFSKNAP